MTLALASHAPSCLQDGVSHMWAGLAGGAISGYNMKGEPTEEVVPPAERLIAAKSGMQNGIATGVVAGSFSQVLSGSSDDGGSSASSGSSSSSSGNNDKPGTAPPPTHSPRAAKQR